MSCSPRIGWHVVSEPDSYSLLLFDLDDPERAWAACDQEIGADDYRVTQYGRRRLWDEVADAYLKWASWGSPGYERFGLTVRADGMGLWVDHPGGPNWGLPSNSLRHIPRL